MYPNERYVNNHFRSYLISRFYYSTVSDLVTIKSLKILAFLPPSHFDIVSSALFLGTGIWPVTMLVEKKKKKKKGKFFLVLLYVHMCQLFTIFGNALFWRASELYFPVIDASDPDADYVFVIKNIFKKSSIYYAPFLVEGFVELLFLMAYSARALKSLAISWNIKWIFSTSKVDSLVEHTSVIRAYSFGATNKVPFVSFFKM